MAKIKYDDLRYRDMILIAREQDKPELLPLFNHAGKLGGELYDAEQAVKRLTKEYADAIVKFEKSANTK